MSKPEKTKADFTTKSASLTTTHTSADDNDYQVEKQRIADKMAQWKCDDATARQMLGMPALENIDDLMGEAANDADTVTTTPASQPSPETGPSDAPVVALPKVGPAYRFSVLRAAGNAKSYRMVDGALVKFQAPPIAKHRHKTVKVKDIKGLFDLVSKLQPGDVILSGVHADAGGTETRRVKEDFPHPSGPGVIVFDGDALVALGVVGVDGLTAAMDKIGIRGGKVIDPSASSGINDGPMEGAHTFMLIGDASTIPAVLKAAHVLAVERGLGRALVTSDGRVLPRSLIDVAMAASNQQAYAGGAICGEGVTQTREVTMVPGGPLQPLPEPAGTYAEVWQALADQAAPAAAEARTRWVGSYATRTGCSQEEADAYLDSLQAGGPLALDHLIYFDDGSEVTVADIVAAPATYQGKTCRDPLDPAYGKGKAKVMGEVINSFAHGGALYSLPPAAAQFEDLGPADNDVDGAGDDDDGDPLHGEHIRLIDARTMGEATSGTLYLVDGFVEAGALGMVWGPSSGFKTFIALDWALCISSGTPWHGRPVTQGPVLYIAGEGQRGIQKRIEAWKKANNVDDIGEFYVSTGAINARDPAAATEIIKIVERVGVRPVAILIDTLARNFGGGDENSTQDMGELLDVCDRMLAQRLGATTVLVHHSKKDGTDFRGASALRNGMDFEYEVSRLGNSLVTELTCHKMKDGPPPRPSS